MADSKQSSFLPPPRWPGHDLIRGNPARPTDPATSKEAARKVTSDPATRGFFKKVLDALHEHGGLADFQLASVLGCSQERCRKRRADLASTRMFDPPRVRDSGRRVESPDGMQVIVWEVVE